MFILAIPFGNYKSLNGLPDVHDHNAARMIMIGLVSTRHEDLRPNDFLFEQTVEYKRVDRSVPHNESSEMSSKIIDVPTWKDIPEEIPSNKLVLCLVQPICRSRSRVQDRTVVR
jgi:hypothetical protein